MIWHQTLSLKESTILIKILNIVNKSFVLTSTWSLILTKESNKVHNSVLYSPTKFLFLPHKSLCPPIIWNGTLKLKKEKRNKNEMSHFSREPVYQTPMENPGSRSARR